MSQLIDLSLQLSWLAYSNFHVPSNGFAAFKLLGHLSDLGSCAICGMVQTRTLQKVLIFAYQTGIFLWIGY